MVRTASTMLPLGTTAPGFALPDPDGHIVRLNDFDKSPALLVMFICNHCPYVQHIRHGLAALIKEYQPRGLAAVGIMSNDYTQYIDDHPDKMRAEVQAIGYTFPYLVDATQTVAKDYMAACTPDFFLFDKNRKLVYRGQLDDARPKSDVPVTGTDLRIAIDAVLAGKPVNPDQRPSLGCNIKWKPGNEPTYFRL